MGLTAVFNGCWYWCPIVGGALEESRWWLWWMVEKVVVGFTMVVRIWWRMNAECDCRCPNGRCCMGAFGEWRWGKGVLELEGGDVIISFLRGFASSSHQQHRSLVPDHIYSLGRGERRSYNRERICWENERYGPPIHGNLTHIVMLIPYSCAINQCMDIYHIISLV